MPFPISVSLDFLTSGLRKRSEPQGEPSARPASQPVATPTPQEEPSARPASQPVSIPTPQRPQTYAWLRGRGPPGPRRPTSRQTVGGKDHHGGGADPRGTKEALDAQRAVRSGSIPHSHGVYPESGAAHSQNPFTLIHPASLVPKPYSPALSSISAPELDNPSSYMVQAPSLNSLTCCTPPPSPPSPLSTWSTHSNDSFDQSPFLTPNEFPYPPPSPSTASSIPSWNTHTDVSSNSNWSVSSSNLNPYAEPFVPLSARDKSDLGRHLDRACGALLNANESASEAISSIKESLSLLREELRQVREELNNHHLLRRQNPRWDFIEGRAASPGYRVFTENVQLSKADRERLFPPSQDPADLGRSERHGLFMKVCHHLDQRFPDQRPRSPTFSEENLALRRFEDLMEQLASSSSSGESSTASSQTSPTPSPTPSLTEASTQTPRFCCGKRCFAIEEEKVYEVHQGRKTLAELIRSSQAF